MKPVKSTRKSTKKNKANAEVKLTVAPAVESESTKTTGISKPRTKLATPIIAAKPVGERSSKTTPVEPTKPALVAKVSATKTITTVEAKIDVGFGNNLYLRGEGAGLSWERGTLLRCVDQSTWLWSAEASDTVKVKLLLNDSVWMAGEDLVLPPGKHVEISPAF